MPGFTTHYLFGQQTYQLIHNSTLKQTIQKNHTVFCLGLQGPDIFFYDILSLMTPKKNPGSTAHTADTRKFLRYLLESPRIFPADREQQIAHTYILGFIGHYLLDTACHPYVYAKSRYGQTTRGYIGGHIRLETDIDTTLLWHYQRRLPSEFHQNESIFLSADQRMVVSTLLYYAFSKTYPGLGLTRHRILQAIHAMQLATKLLYDPSGRKKSLIRRLEAVFPGYPVLSPLIPSDTLIFHKDPCNLSHHIWANPWDQKHRSSESFVDLFEKAKIQYGRMLNDIAAFFATEHSPKEEQAAIAKLLSSLGNLCYHSGLHSAPYVY